MSHIQYAGTGREGFTLGFLFPFFFFHSIVHRHAFGLMFGPGFFQVLAHQYAIGLIFGPGFFSCNCSQECVWSNVWTCSPLFFHVITHRYAFCLLQKTSQDEGTVQEPGQGCKKRSSSENKE